MKFTRRFTLLHKVLPAVVFGISLLPTPGCGDDPARMAGTIEMPKREVGRPNLDRLASDAKAKSSQPAPGR